MKKTWFATAPSRRAMLVTLFAVALALAPGLDARASQTDPKGFVESLSQTVIDALAKGAKQKERAKLFAELFEKSVDMDSVGRFVLGRYYRQATPDQIARYNTLFRDFVVLTYAQKLSDYAGQRMTIKSAVADGDLSTVASAIERADGPPILVDWRVKQVGPDLRIVDVVIEGVSMAQSQREDFSSVIQAGGGNVEALLARLTDQNAKLRAAAN